MFLCSSSSGGGSRSLNKENNVFKDAIGVKGLRFKLHGNNYGNHDKHYGNLFVIIMIIITVIMDYGPL